MSSFQMKMIHFLNAIPLAEQLYKGPGSPLMV